MSKAALGEPLRLPHTPKRQRMYAGVSMYASLESAQERAQKLASRPTHIAQIAIPSDGPLAFEQTGVDPQHFTVWGTSAEMLELVPSVVDIEQLTSDT